MMGFARNAAGDFAASFGRENFVRSIVAEIVRNSAILYSYALYTIYINFLLNQILEGRCR